MRPGHEAPEISSSLRAWMHGIQRFNEAGARSPGDPVAARAADDQVGLASMRPGHEAPEI